MIFSFKMVLVNVSVVFTKQVCSFVRFYWDTKIRAWKGKKRLSDPKGILGSCVFQGLDSGLRGWCFHFCFQQLSTISLLSQRVVGS